METETSNCHELILDDVVGVAFCLFDNSTFSRPQNVQSTDIVLQGQYSEIAGFHLSDPDATFQLSQSPAVSLTTARAEQGLIHTHELSLGITDKVSDAEHVVSQLQHTDFTVIYYKVDGSCFLSLPFPNATLVTIEEAAGSGVSASVKVKMQSASGLINLTFANS